jgi:nucleotide-binding universal stress UspA family protein
LHDLIDKFKGFQRDGSMEGHAAVGDRVDLIVDRANKNNYDLICMGISGESAVDDLFMGNTTLGVVRNASTPILVVPRDAKPSVLKTIVLAVDNHGISTPGLLRQLVALAKLQGTEIKVYHHATPGQPDQMPPSVEKELEGLTFSYHSVIPETDDISEGIQHFVKEQHADLLCLIRRRRGFLSRLFSENVSRDSLFDSKIPILIVKD